MKPPKVPAIATIAPPKKKDPLYSNKLPKTLPRKAMHTRGRNRGC